MRVGRSAGIVGIHAVTSANALHHAYNSATTPESRLLLLLQAAGWMAQFRTWAHAREKSLRSLSITDLDPNAERADPETIVSRSAAEVDKASAELVALARDIPARRRFFAAALRSTIPRANEVHYYKYMAALIEDVPLVSNEWQPHLTAATLYYMKRPDEPEAEPISRARKALRG